MAVVAAEIATFLRAQREAHADVADDYARMEELYTRKLWHQLTLAIADFVSHPRQQGTDGGELAQLYEHFIRHFETKMNLLALAKLVIAIARFFPTERATHFVTSLVDKVAADQEAVTLCKTETGRLKLQAGDVAGCKELLDEAQVTVDTLAGMDVDIHIAFYTTLTQYYKVRQRIRTVQSAACQAPCERAQAAPGTGMRAHQTTLRLSRCHAAPTNPPCPLSCRVPISPRAQLQGPATQFYKSALLLLSYQPLDKMAPADALTLSFDLGLAALVAKSVYNFGELLQHPVVACLEATEHAWLAQILRVFNAGDIELYEQLIGAHRAQLEAQPALVAHAAFLKEKIALMSLMELVFGHVGPQADHSLSFDLIAQRVRLPLAEVSRCRACAPRARLRAIARGEIALSWLCRRRAARA